MKKCRKLLALAAAATLAACTAVSTLSGGVVFAATENTITITQADASDTATHSYKLYQIFSGTVTDGQLQGIAWATGVTSDTILSALKSSTTVVATENVTLGSCFANCTSAAEVAAVLNGKGVDSTFMKAFAAVIGANTSVLGTATTVSSNTATVSSDGYYLLVDDTSSTMTDGAKTRYIVFQYDASFGLDITVKSSLPTVEKKVKETSTTNTISYDESSGDTKAYVGENFNDVADYSIGDAIEFELIGTMPSTLDDYATYKYVFHDTLSTGLTYDATTGVTVKIGENTVDPDCYTVTTSDTTNLTISFDDIKSVKVDDNTSGATGGSAITVDKNTVVYVYYKAALNANATIGLNGNENEVYLEYSNNPNAEGSSETGKTTTDKVIVFTYELDITKYLDSVAETNKAGENKAGFKLKNSSGEYATLSGNKITGWDSTGTEIKTDASGLVKFIGLDEGTYTLEETTVPDGYNKMTDKTLVITATTVNDQKWNGTASTALTKLTLKEDSNSEVESADKGAVSLSVINVSGSTLPSTGGIGTTLFYIGGGVLVVGAGVLLITKKRAKDAQ